jgi:hypothetical protein
MKWDLTRFTNEQSIFNRVQVQSVALGEPKITNPCNEITIAGSSGAGGAPGTLWMGADGQWHTGVWGHGGEAGQVYGPNGYVTVALDFSNLNDPIKEEPHGQIDRSTPPARPVNIRFEAGGITIYETDSFGGTHRRYTIPYGIVDTIQVLQGTELITLKQAEALELLSDLRDAQANLFAVSEKLRTHSQNSQQAHELAMNAMKAKHERELTEANSRATIYKDGYDKCLAEIKCKNEELEALRKYKADQEEFLERFAIHD